MQNYELLYIVSSNYTENELASIREKINSLLVKYGAILGYQEFLGKKKLAYPINKINHGYYAVVEFELENGPAIKDINNDLRLDKEVLRAQIIAKPKITEAEIRRQEKQKARVAEEISHPKTEYAKRETKPAVKTKETKKVRMKQLDEKIDEMLKDDVII